MTAVRVTILGLGVVAFVGMGLAQAAPAETGLQSCLADCKRARLSETNRASSRLDCETEAASDPDLIRAEIDRTTTTTPRPSTGIFNKNPHLIYGGAVGKLHPNGKWPYLAENGTSPRDIRKFSLADDGESTYLYDSPYHGEYSIGGKLWFNSKGDKILTNSVILTTSDKMEDDMKYAGKLALPMFDHYFPYVWSASYSNSDNKWYVLLEFSFPSGHTAPSVYAFDSESFEVSKLTGLDSFYDENGNSAGFDLLPLQTPSKHPQLLSLETQPMPLFYC